MRGSGGVAGGVAEVVQGQGVTQPGGPGADEIRAALETVWLRPEFIERPPGLLARALGWVGERFSALLDWLRAQLPALDGLLSATWAGRALLVAALAVGVWAIVLLVLHLAPRFRDRTRNGGAAGERAPRPASDPSWWDAKAREALGAGRVREAAFARYRALLLRLAEADLVRLRDGGTPGEYLSQLGGRAPAPARAYRGFLGHFLPVAFGGGVPVPAAYAPVEAAARAVEEAVGTGAARAVEAAAGENTTRGTDASMDPGGASPP